LDKRRIPILLVIGFFMLVTVSHIALYAGSFEPDGLSGFGWPYALAVEVSIIICAYFTKWQTTQRPAWLGYFAFVMASGVMNVGFIQPESVPAWTYALFPTAAISLLGFLYRQIDTLVKPAERRQSAGNTESTAMNDRKVAGSRAERSAELPLWLPVVSDSLRQFKQLVECGEISLPAGLTGADLQRDIPAVGTDRTGRNWLEAVGYRHNGSGRETE
jgi:hypothetical protein